MMSKRGSFRPRSVGRALSLLGLGLLPSLVHLGCRNRGGDCEQTLTCDPTDGTAGGAGASGAVEVCDPGLEECTGAAAVYVSPLGDDDGAGSAGDPVATLGRALELAGEQGAAVYACSDEGSYQESLRLEETTDVALFGGFSCADFERNDEPVEVVAPEPAGHLVSGSSGVLLADVRLVAPDATEPGESSVALFVSESDDVELLRSELAAGKGADGEAGAGFSEPAEAGADGNDGFESCTVLGGINPGAEAADNPCSEAKGGKGGAGGGGALSSSGVDGDGGEPSDFAGGEPGEGQGESSCSSGGEGESGAAGEVGGPANSIGSLASSGYRASVANAGRAGRAGQGGGGGGGAAKPASCGGTNTGASGGSGGGGGCPGAGAEGGQSGGGSFGLLSFQSEVSLGMVAITVAEGGAGGAGGDGQLGGPGGAAGMGGAPTVVGASPACDGGKGGKGGDGGSGGGGAGGPSIGIGFAGSEPLREAVEVDLPPAGGEGAAGGALNEDAGRGPEGLVEEVQEI